MGPWQLWQTLASGLQPDRPLPSSLFTLFPWAERLPVSTLLMLSPHHCMLSSGV